MTVRHRKVHFSGVPSRWWKKRHAVRHPLFGSLRLRPNWALRLDFISPNYYSSLCWRAKSSQAMHSHLPWTTNSSLSSQPFTSMIAWNSQPFPWSSPHRTTWQPLDASPSNFSIATHGYRVLSYCIRHLSFAESRPASKSRVVRVNTMTYLAYIQRVLYSISPHFKQQFCTVHRYDIRNSVYKICIGSRNDLSRWGCGFCTSDFAGALNAMLN